MKTNNIEENCNSTEIPELLTQKQVAEMLNLSVKWCERQRWAGGGPLYRKIGGSVRYELSDVLEYINSHPKLGNSSQGAGVVK